MHQSSPIMPPCITRLRYKPRAVPSLARLLFPVLPLAPDVGSCCVPSQVSTLRLLLLLSQSPQAQRALALHGATPVIFPLTTSTTLTVRLAAVRVIDSLMSSHHLHQVRHGQCHATTPPALGQTWTVTFLLSDCLFALHLVVHLLRFICKEAR
jgi:hypothetical protein